MKWFDPKHFTKTKCPKGKWPFRSHNFGPVTIGCDPGTPKVFVYTRQCSKCSVYSLRTVWA